MALKWMPSYRINSKGHCTFHWILFHRLRLHFDYFDLPVLTYFFYKSNQLVEKKYVIHLHLFGWSNLELEGRINWQDANNHLMNRYTIIKRINYAIWRGRMESAIFGARRCNWPTLTASLQRAPVHLYREIVKRGNVHYHEFHYVYIFNKENLFL